MHVLGGMFRPGRLIDKEVNNICLHRGMGLKKTQFDGTEINGIC